MSLTKLDHDMIHICGDAPLYIGWCAALKLNPTCARVCFDARTLYPLEKKNPQIAIPQEVWDIRAYHQTRKRLEPTKFRHNKGSAPPRNRMHGHSTPRSGHDFDPILIEKIWMNLYVIFSFQDIFHLLNLFIYCNWLISNLTSVIVCRKLGSHRIYPNTIQRRDCDLSVVAL